MELKIIKIIIDNFKGVKHKEIALNGKSARLCAQNGGFKTTTADAFYFCFADCNTALVKNPDVIPIGVDECQPTVRIELSLDDKPLTICKQQKFKKKEVDGKITSSTSNTYFINDVEKSYRDFVADLNARGIDTEKFLIFSHPGAFLADTSKQGRERIRNILFKMCEETSDVDIVSNMKGVEELEKLIADYRIDEIEQINKAAIKRINDEVGKDNSIIRARIDELKSQKSKQDSEVFEAQKKEYEAEIERINAEIESLITGKSDSMKKLTELKMARDKMIYEANNKQFKYKNQLEEAARELVSEVSDKKFMLSQSEESIERINNSLTEANHEIENQRISYKEAQDMAIDENEFICPVCHRDFEDEQIEHIKAEFDKKKADRIKVLKASGKALNERIRALEGELKEAEGKVSELKSSINDSEGKLSKVNQEIAEVPREADMTLNTDYAKIVAEIEKLEAEIPKNQNEIIEELKSQRNVNKAMLNQVISEIGYLAKNDDIDKRIAELRENQRKAEIDRANAEKILNEVDKFKRIKNEIMTEIINKHFKYVNWHLFRYRKNGEYEEITEPYIGDKSLTSHSNQALQIVSKIDIINGLSQFYDMRLPVFIDDSSLLTKNSIDKMQISNQMIFLCAKDGYAEMEIEYA